MALAEENVRRLKAAKQLKYWTLSLLSVGVLILQMVLAPVPVQADTGPVLVSRLEPTVQQANDYTAYAYFNSETHQLSFFEPDSLNSLSDGSSAYVTNLPSYVVEIYLDSGIYLATSVSTGSEAIFTVSSLPNSCSNDIAVIGPDYTWQAYSDFGGRSFYRGAGTDTPLSIQRPVHLAQSNFRNGPQYHPLDFLRSLQIGFDFIAQSEMDLKEYDLSCYKILMLYGHDEYWTPAIRHDIESAVASGTSLINLGANVGYRKVNRVGDLLAFDPEGRKWGARTGDTPPTSLIKVRYSKYPFADHLALDSAALTDEIKAKLIAQGWLRPDEEIDSATLGRGLKVRTGNSPLFQGTGLKGKDTFGSTCDLLAYEQDSLPLLGGSRISNSMFRLLGNRTSYSASGLVGERAKIEGFLVQGTYQRGRVISAGTMGWVGCLILGDGEIQSITLNAISSLLRAPDEVRLNIQHVGMANHSSGWVLVEKYSSNIPKSRSTLTLKCRVVTDSKRKKSSCRVKALGERIYVYKSSKSISRFKVSATLQILPEWAIQYESVRVTKALTFKV